MAEIARNVGYVDQLSLRQFKRRSQRIKIHRFHQRPPQLHNSMKPPCPSLSAERWAVRELGMPMPTLAHKLRISVPAISGAVAHGYKIVDEKGLKLLET